MPNLMARLIAASALAVGVCGPHAQAKAGAGTPGYGDPVDEFRGVFAHCNGKAGNLTGEYQCVEYVKRFFLKVHHVALGPVGTADRAFDTWGARADIGSFANGSSSLPRTGDILCFRGGPAGHVAIVVTATDTKVRVIEQNFHDSEVIADIPVTPGSGFWVQSRGRYKVDGWLRPRPAQGAPGTADARGKETTVFVLDCSGSMGWPTSDGTLKLQAAKDAARHHLDLVRFDVDSLGADHQVGVVSFSADICNELGPTTQFDDVVAALDSQSPVNGTNFGSALDAAIRLLEDLPDDRRSERKTIVFMSDGVTNTGPVARSEFLVDRPDQFANPSHLYQRLSKAGIRVYSIGFGEPGKIAGWGLGGDQDIDEEVLRRVAEVPGTGGRYVHARDALRLDEAFLRSFHSSTGDILFEHTNAIAQGQSTAVGPFNPYAPKVAHRRAGGARVVIRLPLLGTPAHADVPARSQMLVTLGWSAGRLALELTDPSGRVVDDLYPGARVRLGDQPLCVAIDNPQAGNWQATVRGVDVPNGPERYHLLVSARAPPAHQAGGAGVVEVEASPLLLCVLALLLVLGACCLVVAVRRARAPTGAPIAPSVLGWLQVHEPGFAPRNHAVTAATCAIGRGPENDIVLRDPRASVFHAELRTAGQAAELRDADATSGTTVNCLSVRRRVLADGDEVRIGDTLIYYFGPNHGA